MEREGNQMIRNRYLIAGLAVAILVSAVAGCERQSPQRKPRGAPREEPTISLYMHDSGEIKNIKMEDYIAGVVAAEMEPTWPENALAAQAIKARTFTMENIEAGRMQELRGADASTNIEEFQAYDPTRINDRIRNAVSKTRGEVVTYRGEYIRAWFSACDGGVSATAEEGLGFTKEPAPYLRAGARDNCLEITVPENRSWEVRVPLLRVREAVRSVTGRDPGAIASVEISRQGSSGRAEELTFNGVQVSGPSLRLALGSTEVRSMLLSEISIQGDSLLLRGRGFGHGVGMCQWGANKLAQEGKSPEDIIRFYFKGVEIPKLWE